MLTVRNLLAFGYLALAAGCAGLHQGLAAPNAVFYLNEYDTNHTVHLHVGDELVIYITANSSATLGKWQLQQAVEPVLTTRYNPAFAPGRAYYFLANTAGSTVLSLIPAQGKGFMPNFVAHVEVVAATSGEVRNNHL